MKLLIHDYSREEWERLAYKYSGWKVISYTENIRPCAGCFACWAKEPGVCAIKDGYEKMGAMIHEADEVLVISKYTYGGFSSFVKNVFDRSISYILPYLTISHGEMHHKRRYHESKVFSFIFRGNNLKDSEKEAARKYVIAFCKNFYGKIKDISFEEFEEDDMTSCKKIVLAMPLYADGAPSHVLRLMEMMEKQCAASKKQIYVVANMGFYESRQIRNLLGMVKAWSEKCGYEYCGGVAVGAGEMLGKMIRIPDAYNTHARNVALALDELGKAISSSEEVADIYADAYKFSRLFYLIYGNNGWTKTAKRNGLTKKDLLRKAE
ncbi:flavodoxin family protein [Butyrivibrio fibrisolvens]|uniref:flavodoxin family protein n=1 Tax=Butyrivibrio fibrisolvens TaxID=831 RepID=UPI0003B37BC1|nr:flavodoxin family protein [Butyrivibrio fibrisolvens]